MILLKEIKEWKKVSTLQCTISETVILQLAPVVQKVNNAIHWINLYPSGAPNKNIVQNHLNIALLNVI